MIIDCQLKSLLKNYLKTLIVGFGQADALGLRPKSYLKEGGGGIGYSLATQPSDSMLFL